MSDLHRIVVKLSEANAELIAELEKIPPRARAERLRILATIGLKFSNVSLVGSVANSNTVPSESVGERAAFVGQGGKKAQEGGEDETSARAVAPSKRVASLAKSLGA